MSSRSGDFPGAREGGNGEGSASPFGKAGTQGRTSGGATGNGRSQARVLLDLARPAMLAHTPDKEAVARFPVQGHIATAELSSKAFDQWLRYLYYRKTGSAPRAESLKEAINTLKARAVFDGPEVEVFIRVGFDTRAGFGNDAWYLDLGGPDWSAVKLTASGWEVVASSPIWFLRPADMQALPVPTRGESVEALRPFLNLHKEGPPGRPAKPATSKTRRERRKALVAGTTPDDDLVLVIGYLLTAFHPNIPYFLLALIGTHGAGKSTAARVIQRMIDPCLAECEELPADSREIEIGARRHWLRSYDNTSPFGDKVGDSLCRLTTGGSRIDRTLFTNADEFLFRCRRPALLTGIMDVLTRPDLLSRALLWELEEIPPKRRKTEEDFWNDFTIARPGILGALLDAIVHGLGQPIPKLELPRMADAVRWVTRCEGALGWAPGTFAAACERNAASALNILMDDDPVVDAVRDLIAATAPRPDGSRLWEGLASALLETLRKQVGEGDYRSRGMPKTANKLSGALRRATSPLRQLGIFVYRQHTRRGGYVTIFVPISEPKSGNDSGKTSKAKPASRGAAPRPEHPSPSNSRKVSSLASLPSPSPQDQGVTKYEGDDNDDSGDKTEGLGDDTATGDTPPVSSPKRPKTSSSVTDRHASSAESSAKSRKSDDSDASDDKTPKFVGTPAAPPREPRKRRSHKAKKPAKRGRL
jgi:hypothetical protein